MATQEEIDKLKESWKKDPIWDIEHTEGFEEHEAELLAFRKECEIEFQHKAEDRVARRARVVEIDTDITKSGAAQSIHTYEEIEHEVNATQRETDDLEQIKVNLMREQVRATLLLAAQTQRVANGIWELVCNLTDSEDQEIMTRLYSIIQ